MKKDSNIKKDNKIIPKQKKQKKSYIGIVDCRLKLCICMYMRIKRRKLLKLASRKGRLSF